MNRLLLSPNGVAFRADVLRGALFLSICLFLIKASGTASMDLMALLLLLGFATWWMWFAVFAKGYRAAGRPGAMAVLPLIAILLPGGMIDGVVQGVVAPEATLALQTATQQLIEEKGLVAGAVALRETGLQDALVEATAIPVAVVRALYSFGMAWLFARLIPQA